ncbi:hypothetical protein [Streptacidiphilus sp. P02-A3a]|uniref:hypothetical protein n=1 Tax=Streptacidiphilus sp. P02-A3a TaxID=2704468 RepID=UPI0015FB72A9|nr:hypothetical protein [Streptacidiphilus sp. P02-A3a]QMU70643.1 hypothetical protein GXP74_23015 [Streptacidiphilus sp. P02-A3a]
MGTTGGAEDMDVDVAVAPAAPPRRRGVRRTLVAVTAAVVVGGAVGVGAVAVVSGGASATSGTASRTSSGTDSLANPPARHATAAASAPARKPSASHAPESPQSLIQAGSVSASSAALPPPVAPVGYALQRDPDGFTLAVPDAWARSTDASGRVYYMSADQSLRIGVHVTPVSATGPLGDLQAEDAAGPQTNPGYRDAGVVPTTYHSSAGAALWTWTWDGYTPADLGARRVLDLSWVEDGRTYDFWVSAPMADLPQAETVFNAISATFRVG